MDIGITDFIRSLSRPSWVWADKYDFPWLPSVDTDIEKLILNMFNLNPSIHRDKVKIIVPNFEKMSIATFCTDPSNDTVKKYCELAENLPEIEDIMQLMFLASSPHDISTTTLKKKIKY